MNVKNNKLICGLYLSVSLLCGALVTDSVLAANDFSFQLELAAGSNSISEGSSEDIQEAVFTGYFDLGAERKAPFELYAEQPFLTRKSHLRLRYSESDFEIKDLNTAGIGVANFQGAVSAFDDDDLNALYTDEISRIDFDADSLSVGQQSLDDIAAKLSIPGGISGGITGAEIDTALRNEWSLLPIADSSFNTVTNQPAEQNSESFELDGRFVFGDGYIVELGYQQVDNPEFRVEYTTSSTYLIGNINSPVQAGSYEGELAFFLPEPVDGEPVPDWDKDGPGETAAPIVVDFALDSTADSSVFLLPAFQDLPGRVKVYDLDQEVVALGVGAYVRDAMAVVLRYRRSSTDSGAGAFLMDYDEIEAGFNMVNRPQGAAGLIVASVLLKRTEFDEIDQYQTALSSMISYAPNKSLTLGGGFTVNTGSNDLYSSQVYKLNISYFITKNFGVELQGRVENFSDSSSFKEVTPERRESSMVRFFLRL